MKLKETAVNHIVLDSQDEAVKRFFLSLPGELMARMTAQES
jgi:hypothetical protein